MKYDRPRMILDYLQSWGGVLVNMQEVEISVLPDSSLNKIRRTELEYSILSVISIPHLGPQKGFTSAAYCRECANAKEFVETFQLESIRDLHQKISIHTLRNLYNQGKAELACHVDCKFYTYDLYFRIENNTMIVKNDDDLETVLPHILETPQQMLDYTYRQQEIEDGIWN